MSSSARSVASGVALAALVTVGPAFATTLRAGFTETVIASGLVNPTALAVAPDGRVFITQQGGAVRIVQHGTLLPAPFVTVAVSSVGERGLLGIALDPDFAANSFVYVYYTATTPTIHNRVSRFTASGNVAAPASEVVLLNLPALGATNHNGGALHFGPDGLLYIGVGENAVGSNAQSLTSPLGKILRITRDGSIPPSNPFFGDTTGINRAIWALGLRNPFTFAFESGTGRMLINDVGQDSWEEINDGQPGANYGWPFTEGPTSDPRFAAPLHAYPHSTPGVCAITGATFFPLFASQFPDEYRGDYFFADLCAGWIGHFDFATGTPSLDFATGVGTPVDLALTPEGGLYYLERSAGLLVRIDYVSDTPPIIAQGPSSLPVIAGGTATFTVRASGALPLSYQWLRDDVEIAGATAPSYTLATAVADNGARFSVRVSNVHGSVTSAAATLTVVNIVHRPRARSPRATSTGRVARPRR